jgi:hypothetical protein
MPLRVIVGLGAMCGLDCGRATSVGRPPLYMVASRADRHKHLHPSKADVASFLLGTFSFDRLRVGTTSAANCVVESRRFARPHQVIALSRGLERVVVFVCAWRVTTSVIVRNKQR